ncbi:MAG TPA: beta-galactosidase [Bryobacteraceae bacterium]|nr:beta-galactosidase [Bryobacteraceae bacterium]
MCRRVETEVRLIAGIDTAMPDIKNSWSYHAAWNQNDRLWREDFRQLAGCGFDLLRWGMPWSLTEPEEGRYRWDLIDPKIELAAKLGLEIFYPIVHFNYPSWIPRPGEQHAVLSHRLAERLEVFTGKLLGRYKFRLVVPVVEVAMESMQRGGAGKWQPHLRSKTSHRRIWTNLIHAFRASARVAHEHGAQVICCEPAPDIETVLALGDAVDIAGIDLYPHIHRERTIVGYLRDWWRKTGVPLCLAEFGTPETYDPRTRRDAVGRFTQAGVDMHRVLEAKLLRVALEQAHAEAVPIPYGGWYPGTGNIGWGWALTRDRSRNDCDRAGLVDLARQKDGSLKRVLCRDLVQEIIGLRDIYGPVERPQIATGASAA